MQVALDIKLLTRLWKALGGEAGEAEEVAEADGAAGDGEDDAKGGAPAVSFWGRHGWILSREAVLGEAFLGDREGSFTFTVTFTREKDMIFE